MIKFVSDIDLQSIRKKKQGCKRLEVKVDRGTNILRQ